MSTSYDLIVDQLTNQLGLDASEIGPDTTFEELQLDSFAMVELGLMLHEETDVFLFEEFDPQMTLAQAAEHMSRTSNENARGPQ
ncbi:acyl carrier protein [Haloactinospora alba]|uniref:Acyl carrier protein n=1 Tax=Haloactinospora alba TaxID=405555 RepID=A0A543NKP0_9ACTN|nr:acyl carrier protein [Haloactinospora alba]TQN32433.1 acyl carrier protein [Haloactinospora alba]